MNLCIQKFHKKFYISLSGKLLMVGNKIIIRINKSLPNQCYEKAVKIIMSIALLII